VSPIHPDDYSHNSLTRPQNRDTEDRISMGVSNHFKIQPLIGHFLEFTSKFIEKAKGCQFADSHRPKGSFPTLGRGALRDRGHYTRGRRSERGHLKKTPLIHELRWNGGTWGRSPSGAKSPPPLGILLCFPVRSKSIGSFIFCGVRFLRKLF
jgi:hypothetical protein